MVSRVSPADFLIACSTGSIDSIKSLVDSQADVTALTEHGNTCLHLAAQRKDLPVLQFLLDKTPELANQQNHSGNTPIDCYLQGDSSLRVHSILNKFLEISPLDNCNHYGNTIFHQLVGTSYLERVVTRCWIRLTGLKNYLPPPPSNCTARLGHLLFKSFKLPKNFF